MIEFILIYFLGVFIYSLLPLTPFVKTQFEGSYCIWMAASVFSWLTILIIIVGKFLEYAAKFISFLLLKTVK